MLVLCITQVMQKLAYLVKYYCPWLHMLYIEDHGLVGCNQQVHLTLNKNNLEEILFMHYNLTLISLG